MQEKEKNADLQRKDTIYDEGKGVKFLDISYEQAIEIAKMENKRIFIDCYASWCAPCRKMLNTTFKDTRIGNLLNFQFIVIKVNMEKEKDGKMLKNKFGVNVYPTYLLINPDGTLYNSFVGGASVLDFADKLKNALLGIEDESIVVIYVALGLAITLIFGASALNALSTNAIFNILFFLMLVIFAASFFGAFEIRLPSKWGNAVDSKAESTTGLLSIFLMAFTLSLVSFSCTGPIIGFLLVQVSTTGSVVAPAIGMLGFAIALALPFTLFALFPSWLKSMPKSGGWMNVIKVTLGFLELAFALKFLSVADLAYGWRLLDRETFLALWIVIFALLGFYLLGKIKFPHDDDDNKVEVTRFFMALISLAFAVYMVPGLWRVL